MRMPLIATSALALAVAFGAPALASQHTGGAQPQAQQGQGAGTITTQPGQMQQQQMQQQDVTQVPQGAIELIDSNVIGQGGEEVGRVTNVLVDQQGNISHVIVSTGGVMGIASRDVALPLGEIQMQQQQLAISMTEDQLANLPEYEGTQQARQGQGVGEPGVGDGGARRTTD